MEDSQTSTIPDHAFREQICQLKVALAYQKEHTRQLQRVLSSSQRRIIQLWSSSETSRPEDNSFRFLDLLKDIRYMIYDLLVVPGTIAIKYRKAYAYDDRRFHSQTRDETQVQIFWICRQIRSEALPLYTSQNHFIIPRGYLYPNSNIYSSALPPWWNPTTRTTGIRSLSISFDHRDASEWEAVASRAAATWRENMRAGWNSSTGMLADRFQYTMDTFLDQKWVHMALFLSQCKELIYLEIYLANAMDPFGSIRQTRLALSTLVDECPRIGGKQGTKVVVTGLMSDNEVASAELYMEFWRERAKKDGKELVVVVEKGSAYEDGRFLTMSGESTSASYGSPVFRTGAARTQLLQDDVPVRTPATS